MKCIILLTFVTLCYSLPRFTGERNVNISEDGTIVITGTNGKKVTITKGVGAYGQKNIEIVISGQNIPTKKIQINEQNELKNVNLLVDRSNQEGEFDISDEYQRDKRSSKDYKRRFQGDTLTEILKEYQGVVDDGSYEQLLKKVNKAVRSGQLSESVYDVLQSLSQGQNIVGQDQSRWDISRQNQGTVGGQANVLDLLQAQQKLEELLQQQQLRQQQQEWQGGNYGMPVSIFDQQILSPSGQRIVNSIDAQGRIIGTTGQGVILEVPVETQQGQIVERVLLEQPQVIPYPNGRGLVYGVAGSRIDANDISTLVKPRGGQRMIWEDLLNSYGTQNLQQRGVPLTQYGQQTQLSQIIENEREILDQQRRIQQQQLQRQQFQQQEQQQILQRQLQQQQQQQQQQQLLQQLLQQQQQQQQEQQRQQQQLRQVVQQQQQQQQQLQQEVQQQQYQLGQVQQQQRNTLKEYLLKYRPVQDRVRQSEISQQQLGVYPPGVLVGGIGEQRIPVTQSYNVPLVI